MQANPDLHLSGNTSVLNSTCLLEIIDDNGNSCICAGDCGEFVGTELLNYFMPLILYKIDDYAIKLDSACECGRCWNRFTDVDGIRKQEMIIGRFGVKHPFLHFICSDNC